MSHAHLRQAPLSRGPYSGPASTIAMLRSVRSGRAAMRTHGAGAHDGYVVSVSHQNNPVVRRDEVAACPTHAGTLS